MALNYDAPSTVDQISSALASNTAIAASTRDQVAAILGSEPVVVGSWDGSGSVVAPADSAPGLILVNIDQPAGSDVTVSIPEDVQTNPVWIFDTDANIQVTFNSNTSAPSLTVVGGAGNDSVVISSSNSAVTDVDGQSGDVNYLDGGLGADSITGGDGLDIIVGGVGDDSLEGGAGDDTIDGGLGDDTILGGSGNDVFVLSEGDDSIEGGAGYDRLVVEGNEADYTITMNNDGSFQIVGADHSATVKGIEVVIFEDGVEAIGLGEEYAPSNALASWAVEEDENISSDDFINIVEIDPLNSDI